MAVLKASVLAGLIAGAIAAAFHLGLAEPVIERALQQEKQATAERGQTPAAPIVGRTVQRQGLVLGLLLYGALWGVLFGVVYLEAERRRGLWEPRTSGAMLAAAIGWAVAWFPFLKYPANPPGVGEGATIAYRQILYGGFVMLSAVGAAGALLLYRRLPRPPTVRGPGRVVIAAAYVVYAAALYLAMPANPDPMRVSAGLVWTFRAISLAGLVVFWIVLGTSFTYLARARA